MEKVRRGLASLAFALVGLGLCAAPAAAAVICSKGSRVKIRGEGCKPGWTLLATVGGVSDVAGIWEFTSGQFARTYGLSPRFLELSPDGTGRLTLSAGDGDVLTCGTFNYAAGATPTLTMALDSVGYLGTQVVRYALDGPDSLELIGSDGNAARLARASARPPDAECGTLYEVTRFTGLPIPNEWGAVAFDGAQLWYSVQNTDEIVPVEPGTGAAGTPRTFGASIYRYVHASAGAGFWAICACGGDTEVGLVSAANTLVDEVDTDAELGGALSVRAVGWDPDSGVLWIHGSDESGQGRLLRVDPSGAEPDDLLEAFELDGRLSSLAFDGTSLWGLNLGGQTLVRIDPATGRATGSFEIPTAFAYWSSVAVVGSELVLLGSTGTEGAILKVSLTPP
jgi:hypothetical protein